MCRGRQVRDGGAYGCAVPRAYANLNPGLHTSASPSRVSRLHYRTSCYCRPFRWLCSPQTSFCILRQKLLETKRWVDEIIIMLLSYNVSLYGLVFLSVSGVFSASCRNIPIRASAGSFTARPTPRLCTWTPLGDFRPPDTLSVPLPNQNAGSSPGLYRT